MPVAPQSIFVPIAGTIPSKSISSMTTDTPRRFPISFIMATSKPVTLFSLEVTASKLSVPSPTYSNGGKVAFRPTVSSPSERYLEPDRSAAALSAASVVASTSVEAASASVVASTSVEAEAASVVAASVLSEGLPHAPRPNAIVPASKTANAFFIICLLLLLQALYALCIIYIFSGKLQPRRFGFFSISTADE